MASVTVIRKNSSRVGPAIRFRFDYWMLLSIVGLLVIGMLMVYSSTFDLGMREYGDPTHYFKRQIVAVLLGIVITACVIQFDYHIFRRFSIPIMGGTLLALVALLMFGEANFGAVRGLYQNSFQPSEAAKLATILYIAHWLSSKGDRVKHVTYGLVPFATITGLVCFLIVQQPDLSTAGLIGFTSFIMFFVAGASWIQILIASASGAAIFGFLMATVPHATARVVAWQEVLRDPDQAIWQVRQAFIALASGGLTGVGLGNSTQKFGPLPAAHNDGIFAILGEELGLLGCLAVLTLFALLVWRGFVTAQRARDSYGFLLALGITCWLGVEALVNIAVITAVIPFTGIPLPFLSYGGSSMLFTLIGAGILLNISRDAGLSKKVQPNSPATEIGRESVDMRRRNRRTHISGAGRSE